MRNYAIILIILAQTAIFAQSSYIMKLTNPTQLDSKSLDFEITIQSSNTDFFLTSYQCSFSFNLDLAPEDSISLKYIEESSQLANFPINIIGHDSIDGLDELLFVSGIGNDLISTNPITVGKFNISSSREFEMDDLNLQWNFVGTANTILTGENFIDITEPESHFNFDNSVTSIWEAANIIDKFYISQNYPNPFNPSTKVDFTLPKESKVTLIVYNLLGERVLEILNKEMGVGSHTVEIDGRNLASGTYVYVLEAGKYRATKKMILLK